MAGLLAGLQLSGAEARLAEGLALALEPSGWLGRPLEALAAEAGLTLAQAEALLARVQATADPAGLFARDLAECLSLQAGDEGWLDPLAEGVLARLPLVAAGAVDRIARDLRAGEDAVRAVIRRIRGLDPKPGARFAACAAPLRAPDLIAVRGAEGWEVRLNGPALPALRLAGGKGPGRAAAQALIRMVEGRNATLLRVAREILSRQVAALEAGIGALQPMTMAEVADAAGLNQSTVSRAVAGTAVDTPRGTWWLRQLFSQSVGGEGPSAAQRARRWRGWWRRRTRRIPCRMRRWRRRWPGRGRRWRAGRWRNTARCWASRRRMRGRSATGKVASGDDAGPGPR